MKTQFTAYIKVVENENFYFVKKFTSFPELKEVPDFLESFGMHKNFTEACRIAGLTDQNIMSALLTEIENEIEIKNRSKVIHMNNLPSINTAI